MSEIGETLRERRMSLRIDVHEVEEATKIRAKYLRALENEEYDLLPGQAYVKSFLRTYADYLGLDARQLVDDYRAVSGFSEEDLPSTRLVDDESARRRRLAALAAVVVIVVFIALLVALLGGSGS